MRNGYFRLVKMPGGFGLKVYSPTAGGAAVKLDEVLAYLELVHIQNDPVEIKKAMMQLDQQDTIFLGLTDCPPIDEQYQLKISDDAMEAWVRFYPPSETGQRMSFQEFVRDLTSRNVISGVLMDNLQNHFQSDGIYTEDFLVAQGTLPRHGTDARIEYYFNTDLHIQPTMREDGSVDFFNLNMINHCQKGDLLAEIIPEDPGEYGLTINGNRVKPRDVKRQVLKFANNIELSEDRLSIRSKVNGHVMLVDDKVFVSDVYEVENVDISTGNIDFEGSVQINGNVASNFVVKAGGNVIINGVVEGAYVKAGGNIIIARGMNGMSKGTLEADGDIVAKFIENATVTAGGYVHTEAILHSHVTAGTEIEVTGKKGFITGGHVQAYNRIQVKTLGATLGTSTIVEVGINPQVKQEYIDLQKDIGEVAKVIKSTQPIISNFLEKKAKGARFTEDQVKYIKNMAVLLETKKKELAEKNKRMLSLQSMIDLQRKAEVVVQGVVYGGTTIIIGDVSTVLQSSYQYCKFERIGGDVKSVPL
ncbi:MAG: DUF342 domain-containing protein [Lachnospiraceae bacterium]|nr:DUF342 domain-containing protein [Lachnospiraceae bacterium]